MSPRDLARREWTERHYVRPFLAAFGLTIRADDALGRDSAGGYPPAPEKRPCMFLDEIPATFKAENGMLPP